MPYLSPEKASNKLLETIQEIKARNGSPPWREQVLATPRFRLLVHAWQPGFGHAQHYHPRADEIWYILEGRLKVSFDDGEPVVAGLGGILFAKKGIKHDMSSVGEKPLIMLVIVAPNEPDDEISLSPEAAEFNL